MYVKINSDIQLDVTLLGSLYKTEHYGVQFLSSFKSDDFESAKGTRS